MKSSSTTLDNIPGERGSTLGVVIWGLGGLTNLSHRTLIAQFAEQDYNQPTTSVQDAANRFAQFFWNEYINRQGTQIARLRHLMSNPTLTAAEQVERDQLRIGLAGGFCFGGTMRHDRMPVAVEIGYSPLDAGPTIRPLTFGDLGFWGVPNYILRMFLGIDPDLYTAILGSGLWAGTPADLSNLINPMRLVPPGLLPLRDAIDWVHASVYATIKAMKFSQLAPVCGGSVEIAVVTSDRPFRWVRHKRLDAAISQGGAADANSRPN